MKTGMTFAVRQIASAASGHVNDDASGMRANAIWVLDGATGASDVACTPGPSDAAWLARHVSDWLGAKADPAQPLLGQLPQLQAGVIETFTREGYGAGIAQEDTPSTCLGLVEYDAARAKLEIGIIGDISVIVATPDGIIRHFTDPSVEAFSAKSLVLWQEARRRGASLEEAWRVVRPAIRENRRMVNRADGYWVINPVMPWLDGVRRHSVPVPTGARVLLASDGYFRLVDVFARYDAGALLERSFALGLDAVIAELRGIETEDSDCRAYPRMKLNDDATAIIAELVPPLTF